MLLFFWNLMKSNNYLVLTAMRDSESNCRAVPSELFRLRTRDFGLPEAEKYPLGWEKSLFLFFVHLVYFVDKNGFLGIPSRGLPDRRAAHSCGSWAVICGLLD